MAKLAKKQTLKSTDSLLREAKINTNDIIKGLIPTPFRISITFHAEIFASAAVVFTKSTFSKNSFRNIIRESNNLDPADLGPKLFAKVISRMQN